MSDATSESDSEIFERLVQLYVSTCRHPSMPAFAIYQLNADSIHDGVGYPDVLRPGVYAHYDHDGTLIYIGESKNPSDRNWTYQSEARKGERRLPARIDLITVVEGWERFSLEQFLQFKFPNYEGRWTAWDERESQHRLSKEANATKEQAP